MANSHLLVVLYPDGHPLEAMGNYPKVTSHQTVASLQNQVVLQTQPISQPKQVISIHSRGTVTIRAPGTLTINAGGIVRDQRDYSLRQTHFCWGSWTFE